MEPLSSNLSRLVIRPPVDTAQTSTSIPVFPFVTVRSPRLAGSTGTTGGRNISYSEGVGRSKQAKSLSEARAKNADAPLNQRKHMRKLALEDAAQQAAVRVGLRAQAEGFAQLGRWLREVQEGVSPEDLAARPKATPFGEEQILVVWDVLFQRILLVQPLLTFLTRWQSSRPSSFYALRSRRARRQRLLFDKPWPKYFYPTKFSL